MVASLPCYSAGNVEEQRGRGVFGRSIQGLQDLCAAGYGRPGSGLTLDLVYNPNGAFLAPPQSELEVCAIALSCSSLFIVAKGALTMAAQAFPKSSMQGPHDEDWLGKQVRSRCA